MYQYGHYGVALIFIAPVVTVLSAVGFIELGLLAGTGAVGFSMIPDLDQRIPLVTHRGITHTVWFALLMGVITAGIAVAIATTGAVVSALIGFVVGSVTILSHIAADALTPAGVRPWAPVDDTHYSFSVVRAANPLANYALLGVGIIVVGGAAWVGSAVNEIALM